MKSLLILPLVLAATAHAFAQNVPSDAAGQAAETVQQMQQHLQASSGLGSTTSAADPNTPNIRELVKQAATASQAASVQVAAQQTRDQAEDRSDVEKRAQGAALQGAVDDANSLKEKYMRDMYRKNLPQDVAAKVANQDKGEKIIFFASMSMTDGDMRNLMQDALADPRIQIVFQGGAPDGGVPALSRWLQGLSKGLQGFPPVTIDPPKFHKYRIHQVPEAVILINGNEVARVGGVYSTKWMDQALQTSHTGDLGNYGQMSIPSEVDMETELADRIKRFDWKGYTNGLVQNFWRNQKTVNVPHATKPDDYELDPTFTVTHDIRLPDGTVLAYAGDKVNPLKTLPFNVTLLVIDASDPSQRAYASQQVKEDPSGKLRVMSTTVPATSADGWSEWNHWEEDIGTHLYFYSKQYGDRLRLTGTPSLVSGNGLTLKVKQVVVSEPGNG